MDISNNLRGVARQKGEDEAALKRAGGVGEERQRGEEVLEMGVREAPRSSYQPCEL